VAGNATVSGVAATAFLYGGLLGPRPFLALIPVGFAFLFHFGREIIKDMEDAAGDRAGRVRSIPLEYGVPGARIMITAAFLALIVLTLVPAYAGWYGLPYAGLVVPVDLVLLYVLRALWRDASPPSAGRLSRILKADMVLGLAALCLGRI
jgi:geranylgeranylglycerol-phosphate geranylgeranyltransferase